MKDRDRDYIESRLLNPMPNAHQAHQRLLKLGHRVLAAELQVAMREFQDTCREIHRSLT